MYQIIPWDMDYLKQRSYPSTRTAYGTNPPPAWSRRPPRSWARGWVIDDWPLHVRRRPVPSRSPTPPVHGYFRMEVE
eukprot:12910386-Prorocentrum_lima.AAC.1